LRGNIGPYAFVGAVSICLLQTWPAFGGRLGKGGRAWAPLMIQSVAEIVPERSTEFVACPLTSDRNVSRQIAGRYRLAGAHHWDLWRL